VAYLVLGAADAALAAGRPSSRARLITKPALMPLLAVGRDRDTRTALGLSWLGDVALLGRGDRAFLTGLGSFLAAHVAWTHTLRTRRAGRTPALPLGEQRTAIGGYVAAAAALEALLWRRAGPMRMPVVGYGVVLLAMAVESVRGPSRSAAAGGALFVASDALLALDRFTDVRLHGHDAIVMATYTTAQALLARDGRQAG
jgi:uncharacterized membrane protein YhhN